MNVGMFRLYHRIKSIPQRLLGYRNWNSDLDQIALIKDPRVIFDIGANVGQTALRCRVLFPEAQIFSFEPELEAYKALQKRFAADKLVETIEAAVSDERSVVPLYILKHSEVNSLLKPEGDWTETNAAIKVRTTTVDEFCVERRINQVDIMKLDVQGSELAVFRGTEKMFRRKAIRNIFVEVMFSPMYSGGALFCSLDALLRQKGFRLCGLYSLSPDHDGWLLFANALYRLAS
jgi:FkbM family methyltransferase